MSGQKPIQVVQPLKLQTVPVKTQPDNQSQSAPQYHHVPVSLTSLSSGIMPNSSGTYATSSIAQSPLLQQNVNIMNINLPGQHGAVSSGIPGGQQINLMPGTIIQLPDGRLIMPQQHPQSQTIYLQMPPVSGSQPGSYMNAVPQTQLASSVQSGQQIQQPTFVMGYPGASGGVCQMVQNNVSSTPMQQPQVRRAVPAQNISSAPQIYPFPNTAQPQPVSFTRLPNGQLAFCRPVAPTQSAGTSTYTPQPSSTTPNKDNTLSEPSSHPLATVQQRIVNNSPLDVLAKVDVEIAHLQELPNHSEYQVNMMNQLKEIRAQIQTLVSSSPSVTVSTNTPPIITNSAGPAPLKISPLPRNTTPQPRSKPVLSQTTRQELLSILRNLNFLFKPNLNEETVLVEFRLHTQRYHLRMTRAQKSGLEQILTQSTPIRQSEILQFLQEEQQKSDHIPVQKSILTNPENSCPKEAVQPKSASQLLRQQKQPILPNASPIQPRSVLMSPHSVQHSMNRSVKQSPAILQTGIHSTFFDIRPLLKEPIVDDQQRTLSNHTQNITTPISVSSQSTNSSFLTQCNSLPSRTTSIPLTPAAFAGLSARPKVPGLRQQAPPKVVPGVQSAQQQAWAIQMRRIANMRRLHNADHLLVLQPNTKVPFRNRSNAIQRLLPYHVYQDHENSDAALCKVDSIIAEAEISVLKRKTNVIASCEALFLKEALCDIPPNDMLITDSLTVDTDRALLDLEMRLAAGQRSGGEMVIRPLTFDEHGIGRTVGISGSTNRCSEGGESGVVVQGVENMDTAPCDSQETKDVTIKMEDSEENFQFPFTSDDLFEDVDFPKTSRIDRLPWETDDYESQPTTQHSEDPDLDAAIRSILF